MGAVDAPTVHGEGVVAKRVASTYQAGRRTGDWRKLRINMAQEFVIGGYTHGVAPFNAVLVGFYRDLVVKLSKSRQQYPNTPVELIFCASVRNGFVTASRHSLFKRVWQLHQVPRLRLAVQTWNNSIIHFVGDREVELPNLRPR